MSEASYAARAPGPEALLDLQAWAHSVEDGIVPDVLMAKRRSVKKAMSTSRVATHLCHELLLLRRCRIATAAMSADLRHYLAAGDQCIGDL